MQTKTNVISIRIHCNQTNNHLVNPACVRVMLLDAISKELNLTLKKSKTRPIDNICLVHGESSLARKSEKKTQGTDNLISPKTAFCTTTFIYSE